jgi:hypothetical protein
MGMRAHLLQITSGELLRFQQNPKSVKRNIRAINRGDLGSMMAAFEGLQPVSEKVRTLNLGPEEAKRAQSEMLEQIAQIAGGFGTGSGRNGLDLEKSWHVLHYLLTGKPAQAPPPLGNAILGGEEIGDDLGHGPARFLTPEEVRDVAASLAAVSKKDLAQRFDLQGMIEAKVYPVRDDSELGLALDYFEHLSHYYADAAANGNAMLLYID